MPREQIACRAVEPVSRLQSVRYNGVLAWPVFHIEILFRYEVTSSAGSHVRPPLVLCPSRTARRRERRSKPRHFAVVLWVSNSDAKRAYSTSTALNRRWYSSLLIFCAV